MDQRIQTGPQLAEQLEQILERDARFDVTALSRDPEGDPEDGLAMDRDIDSFTVGGNSLELAIRAIRPEFEAIDLAVFF